MQNYAFEIRIKGRMQADNRVHAELAIRNGLSFNARLWDAIDDHLITTQPSPIDTLRGINDKHTAKDND